MSCRYLWKYKGVYSPRCGCYPCWEKYFTANVGKTAAWIAVLEVHGFKYLEGAKGTTFAKMLKVYNEAIQKRA